MYAGESNDVVDNTWHCDAIYEKQECKIKTTKKA